MAGLNTAQIIDRARNQGINLSNDQADNILKQSFVQNMYGADPNKVDSLLGSYRSPSQSSSQSYSAPNTSDPRSYINMALDEYKRSIQPSIDTMRGQIPEIKTSIANEKSRLEGEKSTVTDRYNNLIAKIKGNQQVAETRQTTTTNNELARRGITNDSGLYEQTMTDALNPITQQYTGLVTDAGIAQEADLKDLSSRISGLSDKETEAIRSVLTNIANLESGAGQSAITTGLNLFQSDKQSEAAAKTAAVEQALKEAQLAIQQKQLENETLKTQYDVNKPYSTAQDSGIGSLLSMLGVGTNTTPKQSSKYVVGTMSDGRYLWSDGTAGWTGGM